MTFTVRRGSTLLVAAMLVTSAFACGGSNSGQEATNPPNGEDGSAAASCDSLQNAASAEVSSALAAHQACAVDTDCVQIGFAASCFDSCSRVVAKDGVADVTAAKDRVNAGQCKQFLAQGCKFDIPPCDPPRAAVCKAGVCGDR